MADIVPLFVTKSELIGFDRFWAEYPRKRDKLDAKRAWAKAIKIATPEEIIAGAQRYAKTAVEPFVKLPATFLNKGSWMDEETPKPSVEPSYDRQKALRAQAEKGNQFSAYLLRRDYGE